MQHISKTKHTICNYSTDSNVPEHIIKLCDSSNEATCVIDCDGNFIYANRNIELFYGIDTKALINTHVLKNPLRNKFNADESILTTGTVGLDAIYYRQPVHNFGLYDKKKSILLSAFPYYDFDTGNCFVFIQHTNIDPLQKALLENYREVLRKNISISNEGIAGFPSSIIAIDSAMKTLLHKLQKAARRNSNVLLRGETGVGKEVLARGIHSVSSRCDGPFIDVNCGSIPPELFEAEFFGYEKGAFTSAVQARAGYFELADGGTIFLDELGELPPNFQVKLLRVLESRECRRIGGKKSLKLDFRIIAATNKNLEKAVEEGLFRSDLYFRLNVIAAVIPPLRERPRDIIPLAKSFVDYFNHRENLHRKLSSEACATLLEYDWPGNIRELRNVVERCVALAGQDIIMKSDLDLPEIAKDEFPEIAGQSLNDLVGKYEMEIIERRIEAKGSIRKAAKSLGVSHTTLLRKLEQRESQE